jgi:hypothetical protein
MALLTVGWAITGLLLYALSTFLTSAVLAAIVLVAWVIVKLVPVSRKNKSLASWLCVITGLLTGVCGLALRIAHQHDRVLVRLIFVGMCLGAGLIVLDRRADDWS